MEILLLYIRLHGINIIVLEILNKRMEFFQKRKTHKIFIQTHIAVKIPVK